MAPKIEWDNLGFGLYKTKEMYIAKCIKGGAWQNGEFLPFGNISISPSAGVLNYGQGLFEGLKALRTKKDEVVLFRPIENGKRLAYGAERLCMPVLDPEEFVKIIKELVKRNIDYVPPYKKGSLYIRPCMWGTGAILGLSPAPEYTFSAFCSPVGEYFKTGFKPIKLEITDKFHRAAPKGVGHIKTICNYAGGMYPSSISKSKGFNECVYLDAKEEKYIEEVGAGNFFCIHGNTLSTPKTGSILNGVTRRSVMAIAEKYLDMNIYEKDISVEDAFSADEAFCTGTAAVITSIGSIQYQDKTVEFNDFNIGPKTKELYDLLTKIQLKEEEDIFNWIDIIE